jgi:hypothetical protein
LTDLYQRALQNKRLTDAELTATFAADVQILWADKTLRRAYFAEIEALVDDGVASWELWPYLDDCLAIGYDIWCSEWTRAYIIAGAVSYDSMLSKLRMETLWKSGNGRACKWATEDSFQKRFDEAASQERYRVEKKRQNAIEKAALEERLRIEQEQHGWLNALWYQSGTVPPQQAHQNANSGRGQMGPPPPF